MKAYRGRGDIGHLVLNFTAGWKGVVNFMPQALYPQERTLVLIG
jgi:hypothetical protein